MERDGVEVDVLAHAPDEAHGLFDAWGRPDKNSWLKVPLALPVGNAAIHIVADDREAAAVAVKACAGRTPGELALGVPDPTMIAGLEREFAAAEWKVFNPDGRVAGTTGLGVFLESWLEVARDSHAGFAAVSRWLRCPAAWVLLADLAPEFPPQRMCEALDLLQGEFFPETLEDAVRAAGQWADCGPGAGITSGSG